MTKRFKVSLDGSKCRSYGFHNGISYEAGRPPKIVEEKDLQQFIDAGVFFIEPMERAQLKAPPKKGPTLSDTDSIDRAEATKVKSTPAETTEEESEAEETESSDKAPEESTIGDAPSGELDVSSALGSSSATGKKTSTRKTSSRRK